MSVVVVVVVVIIMKLKLIIHFLIISIFCCQQIYTFTCKLLLCNALEVLIKHNANSGRVVVDVATKFVHNLIWQEHLNHTHAHFSWTFNSPTSLAQPLKLNCFLFLLQGRCNREKPPCKYFHPPQHLKDQLLINGRNHLALKNALMQQMGIGPSQPVIPGQVPAMVSKTNFFLCVNFFFCFFFGYIPFAR